MAANKSLSGSIALTKMKHVKMTCKGQTGPVDGIFIPLAANKLVVGKPDADGNTAVYVNFNMTVKDAPDSYGNSGIINKAIDLKANYNKTWSQMTDEEKEDSKQYTPILGNVKVWESNSQSADASGNAGGASTFEPTDDVPF